MTPDDPRHGTRAGYDAHRRARQNACPPCKAAAARAENLRRLYPGPRITDAAPSARRIQALVALGWTYGQIGKWLDVSHDMPPKWAHQRGTVIRTSVARRIAKTYEARSMTTPPTTTGRDRWRISYAQTTARRNGWLPPLAWDDIDAGILATPDPCDDHDPAVIERILGGDWRLPATPSERREVLRRWENSGRTARQLEALTGWNLARDKRKAA